MMRSVARWALLLMTSTTLVTSYSYTCRTGCSFTYLSEPLPYTLTDDGANCEIVCPVGIIVASEYEVGTYVYVNPPSNIVSCNQINSVSQYCYSGGSIPGTYQYACNGTGRIPIVRGGMASCSNISDTAPIDIDCSTYTNATTALLCSANYPMATTTSTAAPTTTMPTTTEQTTTEGSTTTTYDSSAPLGLCTPFVATNGVTYENRCTQFDTGATCNDDGEQAACTCSAGQTGYTCGISNTSLQNIALLGGGSANAQTAQDIYSMIRKSKGGGTASFMANVPSLFSSMTDKQKSDLSFAATDMIIDATYEGKTLNLNTAFTMFYDPSLGNCFTFNHWNGSHIYKSRMIGEDAGLTVQLDILPEEYMPFIDTMGINVYITQVGEHIYVESNKITSQPGGWDKIILTRTTTQLLETPKSKCADSTSSAQSYYFTGNYSIDGCYRSCYQDACYAACGCMDPMYSVKENTSACTFSQVPCILDMQEKRGDPSDWPECRCSQPCFSQDYNVYYSRGLLTDELICIQAGELNTTDTCKPRQSYVTVTFRTLEALVQVEEAKYPLSRVFGDIGNVGGLLLGFSMVVLFEWLFWAINMILIVFKQEKHAPSAGEVRRDC